MSAVACPICGTNAQDYTKAGDDGKSVDCRRCGKFSISGTAMAMWSRSDLRRVANASGWIRKNQNIALSSDNLIFLQELKTPSINERAISILQYIANESSDLSSKFLVESLVADGLLAISCSVNPNELDYLLRTYLKDELGFISIESSVSRFFDWQFSYEVAITPKGHSYLDGLTNVNLQSKIGFCAMWFSDTVFPVWTNAIEPAINDAGYDPKRIDGHQHNNRIDDEIIAMLRRSKFVVADFTGQRGGVYFEAGFALGLGLPVIWTCNKQDLENVHFDNRQYNFVLWEEGKLDEFKVALQNRIEATIGRG